MTDYKIHDPRDQRVTAGAATRHPGPFLREEIRESFGLAGPNLASALGVDGAGLQTVLDGKAPVSRDLADRVEALTGIGADLIIAMQAAFDRWSETPQRLRYRELILRRTPRPQDIPRRRGPE